MSSGRSNGILAASIVILSVATVSVTTRITIRYRCNGLGLDDYLIALSCLFLAACCVLTIILSRNAFGRHAWDVSDDKLSQFLRYIVAASATYSCGIALAKASFAVLYMKVQPKPWLVLANKLVVVFVTCQAIEEVFIVVFRCNPISAAYKPGVHGHCLDLKVLWWTAFAFNLCTGLFLFIQPIPLIMKLRLPLVRRIGLAVMMSLGVLVLAISVIRIIYAIQVDDDSSYSLVNPVIWSQVEILALIVCSSMPSFHQFFHVMMSRGHSTGPPSTYDKSVAVQSQRSDAPIATTLGLTPDFSMQRSKNYGFSRTHFGTSSRVTVGELLHDGRSSTERIIPPPAVQSGGAIMVTTSVSRETEPNEEGIPAALAESRATERYLKLQP